MGFVLMTPFLLVRFGLLSILGRGAVLRAAYFAPLQKREKAAYWVYQLSTAAIFPSLFFLRIRTAPSGLYAAGIAVYAAGILLLAVTVCHFAVLSENGFNQSGIYRLSRNPMYIAYFIIFLGCVLLTQSPLLLAFVLIFQISAHWIIRSEERWCREQFGKAYLQYMKRVRRYL